MKLSKQERIGVIVIAVILILVIGVFVFIKPRFDAIGVTKTNLDNKTAEYNAAEERRATKDPLKDQILAAYKEGENLADMFFSEMKSYELDQAFRDFLAQVKTDVYVPDITVGNPATATLTPYYPGTNKVTYDLKTYVSQGVQASEAELAAKSRRDALRAALGEAQTIGASTVSFTVYAKSVDDLIKFFDEVNSYQIGDLRKAIMLSGVTLDLMNADDTKNLEEQIAKVIADGEKAGNDALYKDHDKTPPAGGNNGGGNNAGGNGNENNEGNEGEEGNGGNGGNGNNNDKLNAGEYITSLNVSITFYCVEHMQDPSAQLAKQDAQTK